MVDYRVLQIHSTFRDYMEVIGVTFQPPDSRFYYQPPNTERIHLIPDKANNVSTIIWARSVLFDLTVNWDFDKHPPLPKFIF